METFSTVGQATASEGRPHSGPHDLPKITDAVEPWVLFGGIYLVASIGGIAALLRSKRELTARMFWSAFLNSGLASVGMAFILYESLPLYKLIGVSVLCGVGGVSIVDATVQALLPKITSIMKILFSDHEKPE